MDKGKENLTLAEKIYISVLDHDRGIVYPMSIGAKVSEEQKTDVFQLFEEVNNTYKEKKEMTMELVSVLLESIESLTGLEEKGAETLEFALSVKEKLSDLVVSEKFYKNLKRKSQK